MQVSIKMPDLSTTDSEVTVVQWCVAVGQHVRRGQQLLEVETDKAITVVESVVSGVLQQILVAPNERVEVGQVIAVIELEEAP